MTNITKAAQDALEALYVAHDQTCSVGRPKDWKQIKDAITALRAALQDKAGEVRVVLTDDDLDKIDMDAEAEANQNLEGDQRHWRKAYLRAFSRNLFAAQPAPVVPDDHPLMVFAKECELGAYMEHEVPLAARKAIAASQQKGGQ